MLSRFLKPLSNKYQFTQVSYTAFNQFANVTSVPDHKPPRLEDSPQGRYTGALFSVASRSEALHTVLEDMEALQDLIQKSDAFKFFIANTALKRHEQQSVFDDLYKQANLHDVTQKFITVLVDNKRVDLLPKIIEGYSSYYKILTKEEAITIISAEPLNSNQESQVEEALKKSHPGVNFTLKFEVDSTIMGGLQMYTGNKFMDCSLASRVNKVKSELQKLSV